MRDCAQCGKPVDGQACQSCGYAEQRQTSSHEPVRDPMWGRCEHVYLGQRCAKPGSVSRDTSGPAGDSKWHHTWFCFEHASGVSSRNAVKEPKPPGTVWPWEGKRKPVHIRELAMAVTRERQPGEDDE